MQFVPNNYAHAIGLTATFIGEILDPEDLSVGINGNIGYLIEKQIAGANIPNTPNTLFLELAEAINIAYEFLDDLCPEMALELSNLWDAFCEKMFCDDAPDMEPDYEPESGSFPFFRYDLWEGE